jgi:hypothetical protein
VMKCDSDGMLSVLKEAIAALPSKVVHAQVVLAAVGDVTSGDVTFAETVGAPIFVFGSAKVPGPVRKEALNKSVGFHFHKVIYHFEEALKTVLVEGQPPAMVPKVTGEAEVLQLFEISGKRRSQQHLVVGCNVIKGELARKAHYRVLRPRRDDSGERDIVHEVGPIISQHATATAPPFLRCAPRFRRMCSTRPSACFARLQLCRLRKRTLFGTSRNQWSWLPRGKSVGWAWTTPTARKAISCRRTSSNRSWWTSTASRSKRRLPGRRNKIDAIVRDISDRVELLSAPTTCIGG